MRGGRGVRTLRRGNRLFSSELGRDKVVHLSGLAIGLRRVPNYKVKSELEPFQTLTHLLHKRGKFGAIRGLGARWEDCGAV